ncbi:TolB family protein [Paraburkholderia lacunae]|uniref:Uncharacterized protein n=1 Tax=Paraburkholderia lacunae TaxID=2211104 RepID=A0A370N7E4_9BURK|nr:hypothetical protein [Paraburkholderia lacunae]RDK01428.1 hypothetical protein DLM46_16490 [Paraburkholderia lacunae]
MSAIDNLKDAISGIVVNWPIIRKFANGGSTDTVDTDSGTLPVMAKVVADAQNMFEQAKTDLIAQKGSEINQAADGILAQTQAVAADVNADAGTAAGSALSAAAAASSAQTGANASAASGRYFATVAAGVAGSADGQSFSTLSADDHFLIVYQRQAGAAVEQLRFATQSYLDTGFDFSSYSRSGYVGGIVDSLKRIALGVRASGKIDIGNVQDVGGKVAQNTSISTGPASGASSVVATANGSARTNPRLTADVTALQAAPSNVMLTQGRSNYAWPWTDSQSRVAGGLDFAGNLWSKGLNVTSVITAINAAGVANLVAAAGLSSVVSLTSTYARSGYAWAVIGSSGRVPLGLDFSGNLISKGTNLNARIAALETATPTVTFSPQQLDGAAYGVFIRQVSSHTQLFSVNKATGALVQLTSTGNNVNPAWSNDQSNVLFSTDRNGASEQYFSPVTGGAANRVIPYADLIGWGDSMTAVGSGYFDTLVGLLPGRMGTNQGIGGQQSYQIAARAAGFNLTCNVAGGQIPASGPVSITGLSNFILNTKFSVDVVIAGVPGTITEHYTQANVDNTFTFTPAASYTGPAVNVTNPVAVTPTTTFYSATIASVPLATTRQRIHSIRVGRNDVGKVGYNQATTLANIDSIPQKIASYHKWFFVMGVTSSYGDLPISQGGNQATDAASQTLMDQIAALNAALAARYGANFVDVQAAMIAQGYGQTATVNGSQYTVLNNVWSNDGIHETTVGKQATANLIINSIITPKGW